MQLRIAFAVILFIVSGGLLMNSCQPGDQHEQQQRDRVKKEPEDMGRIAALPDTCRYPADNPPSKEKTEPGRLLFYDPILSGGKDVASATCHHPELVMRKALKYQ